MTDPLLEEPKVKWTKVPIIGLDRASQSADHPFAGAWAKIERGVEHLEEFRRNLDAFSDRGPHYLIPIYNETYTKLKFHLGFKERPPLWRWSLSVGDSLHNFRCALDHAVYALAHEHTDGHLSDSEKRAIMFPIASSPDDFKRKRRRIRSLSIESQEAIEAWQPYQSGHSRRTGRGRQAPAPGGSDGASG